MIIGGVNQFRKNSVDIIKEEVRKSHAKLLSMTVSLCHECHYHIPAYRYELNGKIYLCKYCIFHGASHHIIENDAEFYYSLKTDKNTIWNFDRYLMTEVTDRCNLECPHCYHLPDNKVKDSPIESILERIGFYPDIIKDVVLAGAESSLRKDICELIVEISKMKKLPHILTNGVRFSDENFVRQIADTKKDIVINFGLNHPDYIGNDTVRQKQVQGVYNINKYLPGMLGYIGYTMVSLQELEHILNEICFSDLNASTYRIRSGSEIGLNATDGRIFVSTLVDCSRKWAEKNNLDFFIEQADNNIYHTVVNINGKLIRLIHWCDETNIDMEELKSGPWCDFVPDGITNFLHQIIRRDIWKNKNLILPDRPPARYQAGGSLTENDYTINKYFDNDLKQET